MVAKLPKRGNQLYLPPELLVLRYMRETKDGKPKLHKGKGSASTLSVRKNVTDDVGGDINVVNGMVSPMTGGMSVNVPPESNCPDFLRFDDDVTLFSIYVGLLLKRGLTVRIEEGRKKGKCLVEPEIKMAYSEFTKRIADTQDDWKKQ